MDIMHPRRVINKYSKQLNIKLANADITGGVVEWAWNYAKGKRKLLAFNIHLQMFEQGVSSVANNYQLIVSINTLSQLHLLIEDFLLSKGRISDTEAEFYDDKNFLSHTSARVFADLSELTSIDKRKWYFDNSYMLNPDYKALYKIAAYLK